MKKAALVLLMVVLTTILAVGTVLAAGVIGTPHDITEDVTLQTAGQCSVCHIPHKATGDRLWASPQTSAAGSDALTRGVVGILCSSCHHGDGAYKDNVLQASYAGPYVYGNNSHDMFRNPYIILGEIAGSNLPYSQENDPIDTGFGNNLIQCTTCHNVHDNATNKPFLRDNIRDLCIQCHLHRANDGNDPPTWIGADGAVIGNWFGLGRENRGSHPVGINILGDMPSTNTTPIIVFDDPAADSWMQLFLDPAGNTEFGGPYTDGGGGWNLGRHTATADLILPGAGATAGKDGGVVCISCHAVHGVQSDANPVNDIIQAEVGGAKWNYNPAVNLLAVPQSSGSTLASMTQANGSVNAAEPELNGANMLCESCHRGGSTGPDPFVLLLNDGSGAYKGTFFPNPGGTDYTHPIDDVPVISDIVSSFPLNWPDGGPGSFPTLPSPIPICESCHVPHPARSYIQSRGDIPLGVEMNDPDAIPPVNGAGQFILRDGAFHVCAQCHVSTVSDHHPVGTMIGDVDLIVPVPWDTGQIGKDGFIGNGDPDIECGDCHNMPGAHGWPGPNQINLDPDWWPVNNGRDINDTRLDELPKSQGMSATCELCHYILRNPAYDPAVDVATSPTNTAANDWNIADYPPAGEYQKIGDGTHFLGQVSGTFDWTAGSLDEGATAFDARTTSWTNSNPEGQGWSRWGTVTAGEHLVCESCHEIEPDKNEPGSKLLLYFFAEDTNNAANHNGTSSKFCEGCHGAKGPPETHVMSGDTVSRTGQTIDTDNSNGYELLSGQAPVGTPNPLSWLGGLPGVSTFPGGAAADRMSCDSCHQVHDANTNSRTYILDAPEPNVRPGADLVDYERGVPPVHAAPFTDGLSHPLGNTDGAGGLPDLDYTGFCDQCHWYTYNARPL
jgi:predicted CXXCH cytochrome family protein